MGVFVFILCIALLLFATVDAKYLVYVGGEDINTYDVDLSTGKLTPLSSVPQPNSGWISPFPSNNPSYIASTGADQVSLYATDSTGQLRFLNSVSSGGSDPAYLTWDGTGNYILVSNYGDGDVQTNGSIAVFPILRNSSGTFIGAASQVIYHYGHSTNTDRQNGPHPHQIVLDPFGFNFAHSPDLGVNVVYQYQFVNGMLINNTQTIVNVANDGDGPRHMAFHPKGTFAYVITELSNEIQVYTYDPTQGNLEGPFQIVSTLPDDFNGTSSAAEVRISPDGRFLYASNRGHDSIVQYAIDLASTDFNLKTVGWTSGNQIATPRSFTIHPSGSLMLVGSQATNLVVPFLIDSFSGELKPTGFTTAVDSPECIVFAEYFS